MELGQGDVLGVKGVGPPEQGGGLPCHVLKYAVPQQPDPQPAHVVELSLGILPGHLTAAYRLVEKRQHLRAQKRRSQELMFAADHRLIAGQANGGVRTDHVPGHEGSVPLHRCATRARPSCHYFCGSLRRSRRATMITVAPTSRATMLGITSAGIPAAAP